MEAALSGTDSDQRYWRLVRNRFRKKRSAVWALRVLYVFAFIALFADFIANEKPIYCKQEGTAYFPIFRQYLVDMGLAKPHVPFLHINWRERMDDFEAIYFPPIPYSYHTQDLKHLNFVGPFGEQDISSLHFRHWLGTDKLGRDVAAGMVNGTRMAMLIGIVAMGIAALIGVSLGAIAGYFGDSRLYWSRAGLIFTVIGVLAGLFYGFSVRSFALQEGNLAWELLISFLILAGSIFVFRRVSRLFESWTPLAKKIKIPLDLLVMRLIEIKRSIPTLLLLLAILALVSRPNIFYVMAIIGLLSWTNLARFMRGEMLRIRELEYMEATRALGYSHWRALFRHAIPNGLTPVLVSLSFGIAGAILTEASLSFIGIGVPPEQVTWGTMLYTARSTPYAWWLGLFPGLGIFLTVMAFNLVGEGLSEAIHAR
ncbi:MAG: ABC transporter permease [Saprospiraceae bacterium]